MNLKRNLLPALFFICLVLSTSIGFSSRSVIIFSDPGNMGDRNQALGLYNGYRERLPDIIKVEVNRADPHLLKLAVEHAIQSDSDRPIVVAVGEKTIVPFVEALPFKGATTVHLCHMVTSHHVDMIGKVDFIVVPVHTAAELKKAVADTTTELVETVGVIHNRQISVIDHVYQDHKARISASGPYLGVMLAGDAPTPENKILVFTEEQARKLARFVARIAKNRHLLITNGPRTGKYDPTTLEENKAAHRDGVKDPVTLAFIDELSKNAVLPKHYTLFDFQFGSKNQDMDLILGAIRATGAEILVPGESTSSISESIDILPAGAVTVYDNPAMSAVHHAHVKSEITAGRIKLLPMETWNNTKESL